MKSHAYILVWFTTALLPATAGAQSVTFSNLYNFPATSFSGSNSAGANPYAGGLVLGNLLYGTTDNGGTNGWGTIYRINTDGTGFNVMHTFDKTNGANPQTGLLVLSNVLYGTAGSGGAGNGGTLFRINPDGSGFTNLFYFTNGVANGPSDLLLSDGTFYGTAGGAPYGIIFKIQTDGNGFAIVTNFNYVNGAFPGAGLIVSSNVFYGTASSGGSGNNGTVYKLVDTTIMPLHNFTNSDGWNPTCRLVLSGSTLYGTTQNGGTGGDGVLFKINTDGSGFTNFYNFSGSDGAYPFTGLTLANGVLYGTTTGGGSHSFGGTAFQINPDGTGFTLLHNFNFNAEGSYPRSELFSAGNQLYGTTSAGGPQSGNGGVFAINLPVAPTLNFQKLDNAIVLHWTDTTYSLQSATNVNGTYATILNATSPYTNSLTGAQKFFRLQGN